MMKTPYCIRTLVTTAAALTVIAGQLDAYGVRGVGIEPFEEMTRISIETDDSTYSFIDFSLDAPPRIVIDFGDASHMLPRYSFRGVDRGGVETIRTSQFTTDTVRVVFVLSSASDYSVSRHEENLVIDFENEAGAFAPWNSSSARRSKKVPAVTVEPQPVSEGQPVAHTASVEPQPASDEQRVANAATTEPQPMSEKSAATAKSPAAGPEPGVDLDMPPLQPEETASVAKRISMDFEDAGIRVVLRAFSDFSGQSIIAGKDVKGKVTARITDVPWDQALRMILKAQGYGVELKDGIYVVDKLENLRATEQLEGLEPTVFQLNYLMGSEMIATIQDMLSPRGTIGLDEKTNSLIVTDVPTKISEISSILPQLDRETKQVTIKSELVFVNTIDLFQVGIDWKVGDLTNPRVDVHGEAHTMGARLTDPFLELSLGTFRSGLNVSTILQALQESQLIDVQAQPQITTLDNLEAEVFVGERTPIRVLDVGAQVHEAATIQLIETGIRLTVTPHITNNNKIVMDLKAERSQAVTDPSEFGVKFQTQQGQTTLLVDDGQTAVIGGLTTVDSVDSERSVPYLSKIPLVGKLFRYKSTSTQKKDLLILVTPYIVPVSEAQ